MHKLEVSNLRICYKQYGVRNSEKYGVLLHIFHNTFAEITPILYDNNKYNKLEKDTIINQ